MFIENPELRCIEDKTTLNPAINDEKFRNVLSIDARIQSEQNQNEQNHEIDCIYATYGNEQDLAYLVKWRYNNNGQIEWANSVTYDEVEEIHNTRKKMKWEMYVCNEQCMLVIIE